MCENKHAMMITFPNRYWIEFECRKLLSCMHVSTIHKFLRIKLTSEEINFHCIMQAHFIPVSENVGCSLLIKCKCLYI